MRYTSLIVLVILLVFFCTAQVSALVPSSESDVVISTGGGSGAAELTLTPEGADGKANLIPAERKLSTDLLTRSGSGTAPPEMTAYGSEKVSVEDEIPVYITIIPGTDIGQIRRYATEVTGVDEEHGLVVARIRPAALEQLAALDGVRSVMSVLPPVVNTGDHMSAGDAILRADDLRAATGYGGAGMKIGIISNGVDTLAAAVATGDLPPDVTVLSNAMGGDEGTAMLEIVHDLAPDADLYFHDHGDSYLAFNAAIDDLVAAGCSIVCDDIGWTRQPFFEDGIIAEHISDLITENDIIYVTSAGNDALRHYQGAFYDDGTGWHDFSAGTDTVNYLYADVPVGSMLYVVLEWNDPWGASQNDYDLYLYNNATGALLAKSETDQMATGIPLEYFYYKNTGSSPLRLKVRVHKFSGEDRVLEVFLYPWSGSMTIHQENLDAADSIFGHAAVDGVISTGAIPAYNASSIELFSSRGPVTIAYPSAVSRLKPDICGIDGVSVSGAGGFPSTFYGTSASAPHIAAVAGLLWGLLDTSTADEITALLTGSAVDLGDPGWDAVFGYGRADAMAAYLSASSPPVANFSANATSGNAPLAVQFTDESSGDPDTWEWSFGDNATSTDQHPIHTYAGSGSYTVSLTVTNDRGNDTMVRTGYITVGSAVLPPAANFTANTTYGSAPLTAGFTDLSEGGPTAWEWDFGDGNHSSAQHPVHRYGAAGWYDVSLTVSNAEGNSTLAKSGYIHVVSPQITLIPGNVTLIEGNTVDLALVIRPLPEGLERYNITITFENGSIGRIDGITLPAWASPGSYAPVPAERVWIAGTDSGEEIEPGADNVTLAVITVSGVGDGVTRIMPEVNELRNDDGSDFTPNIAPARLVVTNATVSLKPFPGKSLPPSDLDGDGIYEDINGNGYLDFNDVITYFRYMNWIEDNQPIQYFDFNGNGWIDFNDVILLFRMV